MPSNARIRSSATFHAMVSRTSVPPWRYRSQFIPTEHELPMKDLEELIERTKWMQMQVTALRQAIERVRQGTGSPANSPETMPEKQHGQRLCRVRGSLVKPRRSRIALRRFHHRIWRAKRMRIDERCRAAGPSRGGADREVGFARLAVSRLGCGPVAGRVVRSGGGSDSAFHLDPSSLDGSPRRLGMVRSGSSKLPSRTKYLHPRVSVPILLSWSELRQLS